MPMFKLICLGILAVEAVKTFKTVGTKESFKGAISCVSLFLVFQYVINT